jgi:hypothetical protein
VIDRRQVAGFAEPFGDVRRAGYENRVLETHGASSSLEWRFLARGITGENFFEIIFQKYKMMKNQFLS